MVVDLGTGDGRAVLARAAAEPRSLVIGIDASAASMAEASRRAARAPAKGGVANAVFAVAAAEAPPAELYGIADVITVVLPWGSLLRGVLGRDEAVMAGIADLLRPCGRVEVLVAPSDRDGIAWPAWPIWPAWPAERRATSDGPDTDGLEAAWAGHGLSLTAVEAVTPDDLDATPSTWARRLRLGSGADGGRAAWRLILTKDGAAR